MAGLAPGVPCRLMIVGAVREELHDQLALGLAALDVVGADMGQDARNLVDAAVDGDDRNAGVDRLLERRRHGVDLARADDDAVDALDDRRLDVGGLLRRLSPGRRDSMTVMPPSASASAFIWFIM